MEICYAAVLVGILVGLTGIVILIAYFIMRKKGGALENFARTRGLSISRTNKSHYPKIEGMYKGFPISCYISTIRRLFTGDYTFITAGIPANKNFLIRFYLPNNPSFDDLEENEEDNSDNDFMIEINGPDTLYEVLTKEDCHQLLSNLSHGKNISNFSIKHVKKGNFYESIDEEEDDESNNKIEYIEKGVITDQARLECILDIICRMASRINSL